MPTWGEILAELKATQGNQGQGPPDFDGVRRKYLRRLQEQTGRSTILYSTDWLGGQGHPQTGITLEDMQGMMEVCKALPGPNLDLILHSPGGSAEATASIVNYLRSRFSHIRAFVPLAAMSAATMLALACDEIVMGKQSQLGPIDPQIVRPGGLVPARAVVDEFERAKKEIAETPNVLGAWLPILQQYQPGLLEQCGKQEELARRLVTEWLMKYMLAKVDEADVVADDLATKFSDYPAHQSHAIGIDRERCRSWGVNVTDLEEDQELQDAVLSVHHATLHTFAGAAVKVIENQDGRAFVQIAQAIPVQVPMIQQQQPPPSVLPPVQVP